MLYEVITVEYADHLNADDVLIKKLGSLGNTRVLTGTAAGRVLDNGAKVTGIELKTRESDANETVDVDGIFVQIGLDPNSAPFADLVELNQRGEIMVA